MTTRKAFSLLLAVFISFSCFAKEPQKEKIIINVLDESETSLQGRPICGAVTIEDKSKIIKNPGNCPVEILRRLGRAIAKSWPKNENKLTFASIILNEFVGTPNFIRNVTIKELSMAQQKELESLIKRHESKVENLKKEFKSSDESISINLIANISELGQSLKSLINTENASKSISINEIQKVQNQILPILEILDRGYGTLSLSESGIYGRGMLESDKGRLPELLSIRNISIGKYIDSEPLLALAQTHRIEDPKKVIANLSEIPNMAVVNQLLASAGLDFEKDIISNHATESIFYVNLTPTGKEMIPDLRWVAYLPKIENLVAILPKLKNFCVQTGIFVTPVESGNKEVEIVKLSHWLTQSFGAYTAINGNFCIIASSKEGAAAAIKHLRNLPKDATGEEMKDCNIYCRVKIQDLNIQLQQFLQSPLMVNQGIPPISNLTFLKDMKSFEIKSKITNEKIEMILDIPFFEKK